MNKNSLLLSVQLLERDGAVASAARCRTSGITDHDQLESGKQITTGVACFVCSTPWMLHPNSHRGDYPSSDSVIPTQCHHVALWVPGSEMDLRGQQSFCESCCSHHSLAGSAFEAIQSSGRPCSKGRTVWFTWISLWFVDKVITWVGGGGHVLALSG